MYNHMHGFSKLINLALNQIHICSAFGFVSHNTCACRSVTYWAAPQIGPRMKSSPPLWWLPDSFELIPQNCVIFSYAILDCSVAQTNLGLKDSLAHPRAHALYASNSSSFHSHRNGLTSLEIGPLKPSLLYDPRFLYVFHPRNDDIRIDSGCLYCCKNVCSVLDNDVSTSIYCCRLKLPLKCDCVVVCVLCGVCVSCFAGGAGPFPCNNGIPPSLKCRPPPPLDAWSARGSIPVPRQLAA